MKKINQQADSDLFGEVVYSYTRKQAVADGHQILLTGDNAALARDFGWKYPIYFTRGVWDLIEQSAAYENDPNDLTGILWDFLMTARFGQDVTEDLRKFYITINEKGRPHRHLFYIQVGPTDIDDPAPALTIMQEADR
jgi:hypothetical protein